MRGLIALVAMFFLSVGLAHAADLNQMRSEMLTVSYRVSVGKESGSGTAIFSKTVGGKVHTLILTNNHVIADAKTGDDIEVQQAQFDGAGNLIGTISKPAKVIFADSEKDLAVLELSDHVNAYPVASLAATDADVGVFNHVYVVGCGLGEMPYPTDGIISSTDVEIDGNPYWQISASTIFGNSGGGLFAKVGDHYELIGIPSRVALYGHKVADPNQGFAIKIGTVRAFLSENSLGFIVGK